MNVRPFLLLALAATSAALAAETSPAPSATTPAPAKSAPATPAAAPRMTPAAPAPVSVTVDTFRIIGDRNIFNANRTGRRDRSNEDSQARVDTLSFVGTIQYEKGYFALFDGSEPAFRKGYRTGESVGQFKVTSVSATRVELERDSKPVTLSVGQQLRRAEGGEWAVIGADVARAEAQAAAARQQAAATPVIPADASDVVRRMMERRMQKDSKQP